MEEPIRVRGKHINTYEQCGYEALLAAIGVRAREDYVYCAKALLEGESRDCHLGDYRVIVYDCLRHFRSSCNGWTRADGYSIINHLNEMYGIDERELNKALKAGYIEK